MSDNLQNLRSTIKSLVIAEFQNLHKTANLPGKFECACVIAHTPTFDDGDIPQTRFTTLFFNTPHVTEDTIKCALKLNYQNVTEETRNEVAKSGVLYRLSHYNGDDYFRITSFFPEADKTLLRMLDADNHSQHEVCYVVTSDDVTVTRTAFFSEY